MLFLKRLFSTPRFEAEGRALHVTLAARARLPDFYAALGVPDTIDGRFEMLCVHAHALFHRLKGQGADAEALAQAAYDAMFADLDASLRELGAADLGVGRRIKAMTEALNGRIQAYDRALSAADGEELRGALRRNVYGTVAPAPEQVAAVADYLRRLRSAMAALPVSELLAGRLALPSPELELPRA